VRRAATSRILHHLDRGPALGSASVAHNDMRHLFHGSCGAARRALRALAAPSGGVR